MLIIPGIQLVLPIARHGPFRTDNKFMLEFHVMLTAPRRGDDVAFHKLVLRECCIVTEDVVIRTESLVKYMKLLHFS